MRLPPYAEGDVSCNYVLVVGGAGYIGSHMSLLLAEAGFKVVVVDNLSRGHRDAVLGIPLELVDIRNRAALEGVFDKYPISLVMHFAALAYVGESVEKPAEYYQTNFVGALNLVDVMLTHDVKRLVFSSSCATYGQPNQSPINESAAQRPINPYGRSKLFFEQILSDYASAYSLRSISLRYFNAAGCDRYGRLGERHNPETHLIPLILSEALRVQMGGSPSQSPLVVYGSDFPTPDGSCIRDYIHVSDICDAHLRAARRLLSTDFPVGAEFYNLASGSGFSVYEVIRACRLITGQDIRFRVTARRAGDPAVLVGDATRAQQVLGWKPTFTRLEEVVETAWRYMLANRGDFSAISSQPSAWRN